jgi:hypothetical protein
MGIPIFFSFEAETTRGSLQLKQKHTASKMEPGCRGSQKKVAFGEGPPYATLVLIRRTDTLAPCQLHKQNQTGGTMRRRFKMSKRGSRKLFKKFSGSMRRNYAYNVMRGGIRL